MARQVYLDISARPREVLRVMDQMKEDIARFQMGRGRLWLVIGGLIGVGLLFASIDFQMGYPGLGFTAIGCLFWVGAAAVFVYSLIRGMGRATARVPQQQFDIARQIIHTLRDDVGRKGRIIGWLDLTGPQQRSKLLRTGRTRSGYAKRYYRDPWFSTKIQLVDGNLLRLTLVERIKVKKGYVAGRRQQLKVKLVVNPQVYDIGPGQNLPGLTMDGTILQLQGESPRTMRAQEVLNILKAMYSYLHPKAAIV
jgi:hypothetical protein